jgi:hypothetical protein
MYGHKVVSQVVSLWRTVEGIRPTTVMDISYSPSGEPMRESDPRRLLSTRNILGLENFLGAGPRKGGPGGQDGSDPGGYSLPCTLSCKLVGTVLALSCKLVIISAVYAHHHEKVSFW